MSVFDLCGYPEFEIKFQNIKQGTTVYEINISIKCELIINNTNSSLSIYSVWQERLVRLWNLHDVGLVQFDYE